jgi:hypothetical protein
MMIRTLINSMETVLFLFGCYFLLRRDYFEYFYDLDQGSSSAVMSSNKSNHGMIFYRVYSSLIISVVFKRKRLADEECFVRRYVFIFDRRQYSYG